MVTCSFTNRSSKPRKHWACVTVPVSLVAGWGTECTFSSPFGQWRAVLTKRSPSKATFLVCCHLAGNQIVEGQLVNKPTPAGSEAYRFHPWVADDLGDLVPHVGTRVAGMGDFWSTSLMPEIVEHSPAHQRWSLMQVIPAVGLVIKWWADIYHDDPVVKLRGKIVWSNRTDPSGNKRFEFFALRSGEMIQVNYLKRHGGLQPAQDRLTGSWDMLLNTAPIVLNDGAGLPISANILAFKKFQTAQAAMARRMTPVPSEPIEPVPDTFTEDGLRDLNAAMLGEVVGLCLDWDLGLFGANGRLPRVSSFSTLVESAQREIGSWLESMEVPAVWTAPRPIACGRTPGQTGDQEDFGAVKGTYAVLLGDARWVEMAEYSIQSELFRGTHHYESNLTVLSPDNHPNWVTWDSVTHWHTGVSTDRLGKDPTLSAAPGTGWLGYDDEHRSQKNLAAYMMLTDDPLAEDIVLHQIMTDGACYRVRFPNFGNGAARAQGRTMGTWAHLYVATEHPWVRDRIENVMNNRITSMVTRNPTLLVTGPMKALAVNGPDGRKRVFNADGSLAPTVSIWEHALVVLDLQAVALSPLVPAHISSRAREILTVICEMIAEFGCFQAPGGQWYTVDDILWSGGERPSNGLTVENSTGPTAQMVAFPGAPGTGSWTFAALMVAREVLGPTSRHAAKLNAYGAAISGGLEARDRRTAEWWAAFRSIQPVTLP